MTQNGLSVAIGQLVSEHHAAVYRYAFRLTGTVYDAEDLTQQTFLAAHSTYGQLREASLARAWLFTILRHAHSKWRGKRSPVAATTADIDLAIVPDEIPTEPLVEPARLQAAIDALPDEFKVVVLLFYFEECSYREIAERLSLPPGTVMSRLARAKARLRANLFERDEATVTSTAKTR